jgi:hypothetical protein
MASTVEIWNLALSDVGGSLVVDVLQNSTEADLCRLHYPYALDFILESRDWNFATKRLEVAESAEVEPVFGYDSSFKIPSDALRVMEVWDNKRTEVNTRFTNNNLQWAQEGKYISANTSEQIWVKYIENIEDPNRFTASFSAALSKYLAYRLAIPVAASRSLKTDLLGEYGLLLDAASINDGVTGRTKVLRSNVLISARFRN